MLDRCLASCNHVCRSAVNFLDLKNISNTTLLKPMRTLSYFLIFSFFISLIGQSQAQDLSSFTSSPVRLEYVVDQNAGSAAAGSFVVKNDYPTKDLSQHQLLWELSFDGKVMMTNFYPLGAIKPGDTKYISLRKLFDLHVLDEFDGGLLSLYGEVQEVVAGSNPIRIIGESVVLAEAAPLTLIPGEQYQVVKVGGARIHRIANGNSITIDAYDQIVGLDLGKGNVLTGPIRPVIEFGPSTSSDSLASINKAQTLIDVNGPSQLKVETNSLSGVITYNLYAQGILNIPFSFSESGLQIGLELYNPEVAPSQLNLEVPVRQVGDSLSYLGHERLPSDQIIFGDTRFGFHTVSIDSAGSMNSTDVVFSGVLDIQTPRADFGGTEFSFCLMDDSAVPTNAVTRHTTVPGSKILLLERTLDVPRKSYGAKRNAKPFSAGKWLFEPTSLPN